MTLLLLALQTGLLDLQILQRTFLLSIILFIVVTSTLQSMIEIADPIVLALGASRNRYRGKEERQDPAPREQPCPGGAACWGALGGAAGCRVPPTPGKSQAGSRALHLLPPPRVLAARFWAEPVAAEGAGARHPGGVGAAPGVGTAPLSCASPRSPWKHFRGVSMCLFLLVFPCFMAYKIAHFFHLDFWLLILVSSCMLTSLQVWQLPPPPPGSRWAPRGGHPRLSHTLGPVPVALAQPGLGMLVGVCHLPSGHRQPGAIPPLPR